MDEQHLNEELFSVGKPPVPIPSVDQAWGGMEQLLNKELPVIHTTSAAYSSWLTDGSIAAVVLLRLSLL